MVSLAPGHMASSEKRPTLGQSTPQGILQLGLGEEFPAFLGKELEEHLESAGEEPWVEDDGAKRQKEPGSLKITSLYQPWAAHVQTSFM